MTIAAGPSELRFGDGHTTIEAMTVRRLPGLATAGIASLGAGAIHAAAIGIHAEHAGLARIFVLVAALQLGAGIVSLVRPSRVLAVATIMINVGAVAGWLITRISGVSWIEGLEAAEAAQFADSICALLGAIAVGGALSSTMVGWTEARPPRLLLPGLAAAALAIPAMISGGTHLHSEGGSAAHDPVSSAAAPDATPPGDGGVAAGTGDDHASDDHADDHANDATSTGDPQTDAATPDHTSGHVPEPTAASLWPRPWDPTQPVDLSGVEGVSAEQEARALKLVEDSLRELPKFATTDAAKAAGYTSIGDAGTGSEHYIRIDLIQDDVYLDPTAPESLVYTVDGDKRTLAGAMYIASARPTDDPELVDWAGPLMTWHNHGNLCWDRDGAGVAKVVGIVDANGLCTRGVNTGGANPMVHVWITEHPCGVFAALEGVGAGQAAVAEGERVDMCSGEHREAAPAAEPKPYDPTQPIDLGGVEGVTPEQQAAAENLVAVNVVRLPQWSDYRVAEAAGFTSIGDALTGHEHFIQWDWINDDIILDPDFPESLVYAPQADGTKKLVSAMYMLPTTVALSDVPDIGGALMQWHIHDNLCFSTGNGPRVAGLVNGQGECAAGLQKLQPSAMIHVWITPHRCGPFAALEGVGAGSIEAGQERLCDHAHGS